MAKREVKFFHNGDPRFSIRTYRENGLNGWQVWDNQTNHYALRMNGDPAIYTDKGAWDWAIQRRDNLNHFGPDAPKGTWKPGGRGRPPKNYNGGTYTGGNYSQQYEREPKTETQSFGTFRIPDELVKLAQEELAQSEPQSAIDKLIETTEKNVGLESKEAVDLDAILDQVKVEIERKTDATAEEIKKSMAGIRDGLAASVEHDVFNILEMVEAAKEEIKNHKKVEIKSERGIKVLGGRQHMRFVPLLRAVNAGVLPLMVGPAGTGKTTAGEQLADALDLDFYAISVGAQTTKSDFLGFIDASGTYRDTMFRRAYENGGVFLVDEMDAGNANVLIVLNAALAGKFCAFPDKMVKRHKDFIAISAANTYGMGANRQYVGRNQLDAATLDRFVPFDWPVDEVLEGSFVDGHEHGARWHKVVKAVRKHVDAQAWRVICSPRATIKGAALLGAGFAVGEVVEMTLTNGADASQKTQIHSLALREWDGA